ncbi:unnamed protein product [Paramecium octaurelia]|uniref:AAA+ ATPase domain-containing protein n=1 Tax=Paramecium octaurelia TaxID=43137 RepID=A0A8S1VTH2_PAROT|nr:unnamed protein product [Paramecium octaurelia]
MTEQNQRNVLVAKYIKLVKEVEEKERHVRELRTQTKQKKIEFEKFEDNIKSLNIRGQAVGEILMKINDEKYISKLNSGPRYVVGAKPKLDREKLVVGTRIALDQETYTIVRILPREVDPQVFHMAHEDPGKVKFDEIGGLNDQLRVLRETIELPITNPELFKRVGVKPPKGCLMYGPPGTGKTLIARALACNVQAKFLKIVASSIVDKYIGESARVIREMFTYAKENQPCIIFMDEIDAIGGRRFSDGTSADREIQRTLMELLNQLDGFDDLGKVKVVMATNRPDILDPALLRPGRLDRKVEIPLPNEQARYDILKIHSRTITTKGEVDFEQLAKLCEEFNGADLRNVCTEAGMFAIRADRDYVIEEDYFKAGRKIKDAKKLESKLEYQKKSKSSLNARIGLKIKTLLVLLIMIFSYLVIVFYFVNSISTGSKLLFSTETDSSSTEQFEAFSAIFNQAPEKCSSENENTQNQFNISLQTIVNDKRTTLMIRNIPSNYTVKRLQNEIDFKFSSKYDYLNIPCHLEGGFAFINLKNKKFLHEFFTAFNNRPWNFNKNQVNKSTILVLCIKICKSIVQ